MTRTLVTTAVALACLSASARGAHAQGPSTAVSDPALAQALFDEGKRLLREGKASVACPKLAESQRLDPAGGTLLYLGLCYEALGRTALAWSTFHDALSAARRDGRADREAVAREHIDTLSPRLARLRVVAPTALAHDTSAEVQIDGAPVRGAALDSSAPVDPGLHQIRVVTGGIAVWSTASLVRSGEERSVEVPADVLRSAKGERLASVHSTSTDPSAGDGPRGPSRQGPGPWPWVTFGAGVAAAAVGVGFGVVAMEKKTESDPLCPEGNCTPEGWSAYSSARTAADVSTVLIAAGATVAVASVVWWAVGSSKASSAAQRATASWTLRPSRTAPGTWEF